MFHPRPYVTEAIPSPQMNLEDKNYAPKLEKIVSDISQLNLLEVADLNELLKVSSSYSYKTILSPDRCMTIGL